MLHRLSQGPKIRVVDHDRDCHSGIRYARSELFVLLFFPHSWLTSWPFAMLQLHDLHRLLGQPLRSTCYQIDWFLCGVVFLLLSRTHSLFCSLTSKKPAFSNYNKAGYTAQDAPSKRTFHLRKYTGRTDKRTDGRMDRRMNTTSNRHATAHL